MPNTIVITDTSCLIALTKINILRLLPELYKRIIITEEIYAEFGEPLPEWIEVMQVSNKNYQKMLEIRLDKGEASAIALAMELKDVLLVIDDLKGRKEDENLGLKITGTLGVLFRAKQVGLLTTLKPYLEQLQAADFRVAPNVLEKILKDSGE
jgi:predicted nucleic acid-binding protein